MLEDRNQFGKKNFGIGYFNSRTLKALVKKYYRDYLPFFQELSKYYKVGKNKNEIVETIHLIKETQTLLRDVINEGRIEKDDANKLYSLTTKIENKKRYFLEEVKNVKALQDKIQKIEAKVGISIQDLNVTRELVQQGVREFTKKKEGIGPVLKKTHTMGSVSSIAQGVAASFLGPFYGLAKAGVGFGKDVLNVGREFRNRKLEQESFSNRSKVRTSGSRVISPEVSAGFNPFPRSRYSREEFSRIPNVGKKTTGTLEEFFDKGAYKAKWTKELLKNSKASKKESTSFLNNFRSGILPFVGKAGLFGSLAVGIGLSILKLRELGLAISDFSKAKGRVEEAGERSAVASKMHLDYVKEQGLEEYAKKVGTTPRKVALDIAHMEQQQALSKRISQPWYKKTLQAFHLIDRPELVNVMERTREIEGMSQNRNNFRPSSSIPSSIPGMDDLNRNLLKLTEQLEKGQFQSADNTPNPVGVFDAADSMINDHASGRMTLGDH